MLSRITGKMTLDGLAELIVELLQRRPNSIPSRSLSGPYSGDCMAPAMQQLVSSSAYDAKARKRVFNRVGRELG